MEKNVSVVDEFGNEYEATYPKRAKGLVKNGRARFVDENKICLACPPNKALEDDKMEQIKLTEREIFEKIVELQKQLTEENRNSLYRLGDTVSSLLGESGFQEDGAMVHSINKVCDVFAKREETLGNLLAFYMKAYTDIQKEKEKKAETARASFDHILALMQNIELTPESAERVVLDINERMSVFVSDILNS